MYSFKLLIIQLSNITLNINLSFSFENSCYDYKNWRTDGRKKEKEKHIWF